MFIFQVLSKTPNQLQVIKLNIISTPKCKKKIKKVKDTHICTLNKKGEGACFVSTNITIIIILNKLFLYLYLFESSFLARGFYFR